MKLYLLIIALLFSFSGAFAQSKEAEEEAMYYIRKAYNYSLERNKQEAFRYIKLFETYLEETLRPETISDSIAYYYGHAILEAGNDKDRPIHWKNVYKYLIRSAEQGVPSSMVAVGLSYDNQNNREEARKWYAKAADQDYARAQFLLGMSYWEAKDFGVARQWFLKADAQGYATAALLLALMYGEGQGVPKDDSKATEYFRKAARAGNPVAQQILQMIGRTW